jgi:hypothetical protein
MKYGSGDQLQENAANASVVQALFESLPDLASKEKGWPGARPAARFIAMERHCCKDFSSPKGIVVGLLLFCW